MLQIQIVYICNYKYLILEMFNVEIEHFLVSESLFLTTSVLFQVEKSNLLMWKIFERFLSAALRNGFV